MVRKTGTIETLASQAEIGVLSPGGALLLGSVGITL